MPQVEFDNLTPLHADNANQDCKVVLTFLSESVSVETDEIRWLDGSRAYLNFGRLHLSSIRSGDVFIEVDFGNSLVSDAP